MKLRTPLMAALTLAVAGGLAQAADTAPVKPKAPEASIPFANMGSSIREWQADGEAGVWVQDAQKQWYYAKLYGPCTGLNVASRIGFKTRTTSTLDRFGEIVVPNYPNCAIESFTKSEPPPKEGKRSAGKD